MYETEIIKTEAGDEREFNKCLASALHLVVFAPVPADFKNRSRTFLDRNLIGSRDASLFATLFMLVALQVEHAVALKHGVAQVFRALRIVDAGDIFLFLLDGVLRDVRRLAEIDLTVDLQLLHALHHRLAHARRESDAVGVLQIGGRVGDAEVSGVHALGRRPAADRTAVDLLEAGAADPDPQQHAVGVRVVFAGRDGHEIVHVVLKRLREIVALQDVVGVHVVELHRPVGRKKFGASVGLEPERGFEHQRMARA